MNYGLHSRGKAEYPFLSGSPLSGVQVYGCSIPRLTTDQRSVLLRHSHIHDLFLFTLSIDSRLL